MRHRTDLTTPYLSPNIRPLGATLLRSGTFLLDITCSLQGNSTFRSDRVPIPAHCITFLGRYRIEGHDLDRQNLNLRLQIPVRINIIRIRIIAVSL